MDSNQGFLSIIVFALIFLFSSNLAAQYVPISIDDHQVAITHDMYFVLEDSSMSLTFDQIISPEFQNKFKPNQEPIHSVGAAYWLQITFKGVLKDRSWFLESRDPSVNQIDYYVPNSDGSFQKHLMGNLRSFENKLFKHKNYVIELPNHEEEIIIYVRIQSEKETFFSFRLKSAAFFSSYGFNEYFFLGVFYGLMMIMAVYNLLLFIFVKKKIYIWYVFYVLSCMLICFSEDGLGFQFLWPESPFINNYIERISGGTFLIFFTLYSNAFLGLKKRQPRFYKLIWSVNMIAILSLFFQEALIYNISYSIIYNTPILLIFIAGLIAAFKGDKFAQIFVIALSFVVSSIILLYLKRIGLFNWEELSILPVLFLVYSFNFALVIEVIILSVAVGRFLEHRQEEQAKAVKISQSLFKGIFESSFDAIFVYDCLSQKTIEMNNKAIELFNYSKEEFLKIRPIDFIEENEKQEHSISKTLESSCDKEVNLSFETIGLKKGDERFDCRISITKLVKEEGNLFVIAIKDISRQKKAEKGLEDRIKEIKEKNSKLKKYIESNSELTNFAYVASHDMRQPIRTIKSFSQLLKRHLNQKDIMDTVTDEYLDFIISGSANLEDLINDLLDHSKVSSSNDVNMIQSNLSDVLLKVKLNLNQLIKETKTKIHISDLPTLAIEPTRMLQLFQNIISNAIKFRQKDSICKIAVEAKDLGDAWRISISDNGIGIPENKKDSVFELFSKLHGISEYSGHGIGLATCKKIVEFHEGEIWLESELGAGTTFYFTIKKGLKTPDLLLDKSLEEVGSY